MDAWTYEQVKDFVGMLFDKAIAILTLLLGYKYCRLKERNGNGAGG